MENISRHISYTEAVNSVTAKRLGILNIPTEEQLQKMRLVAKMVFEPLRIHLSVPIYISSMFRSNGLNIAIGGASSSQHMADNGAAMDLDADRYEGTTNEEIFKYIKDNLEFDQLIAEGVEDGHVEWVHCSYSKGSNRKQVLIMYRNQHGTHYMPYTEENYNKFIKE